MIDIFKWEIRDLLRFLDSGTVYLVEWTLKAERISENGVAFDASQIGSTGLGDVNPEQFIPYDSLTEDQVVGWLETIIGADVINEMKTNLVEQLDNLQNPTQGRGVPWPTSAPLNDDPGATWNEHTGQWDPSPADQANVPPATHPPSTDT